MAKKTKKVEEIIDAVDIVADVEINVVTNPSLNYGLPAFGTEFLNWKNYIEKDIEVMKKNFYPKIGSIVTDRDDNRYRFTDIRMIPVEDKKTGTVIPKYYFDLMIIQG